VSLSYSNELLTACRAKGITIGTVLTQGMIYFNPDTSFQNFAVNNYDEIVVGNQMPYIETARGVYNFTTTDAIINWAVSTGKKIRYNSLIWGADVPTWLSSGGYSDTAIRNIMVSYLDTMSKRYKGHQIDYDVINEMGASSSSSIPYDTGNFWEKHTGPHHWIYAFNTVKKNDSTAMLTYNDYANEVTDGSYGKGRNTLALLKLMKADNIPMDRVGLQCHMTMDTGITHRNATMYNLLKGIQALGYVPEVTEFDLGIHVPTADTTQSLLMQAQMCGAFFRTLCDAGVKTICMWGWDDSTSWINTKSGGCGLPCLFRKKVADVWPPKPAYWAAVRALTADTGINITYQNGKIKIRLNYTCIMANQTSGFPLMFNLQNIKQGVFWNSLKTDGSDIYISDSNSNVLPSYLSEFNKGKHLGIIEFNGYVNDSNYSYYYINYGNVSQNTVKDSSALLNGGLVVSHDLSSITGNIIVDKCKNVKLDSIYNPNNLTIDTTQYGLALHTYGSSLAMNKVSSTKIEQTPGSFSCVFTLNDTSIASRFLFSIGNTNNGTNGIENAVNHSDLTRRSYAYSYNNGSIGSNISYIDNCALNDSLYHYILIAWDSSDVYYYVDGKYKPYSYSGSKLPIWGGTEYFKLFSPLTYGSNNMHNGSISFDRFHNVIRDKNFRSSEYNMLLDNFNFWTYETVPTHNFKTYLNRSGYNQYSVSDSLSTLSDSSSFKLYDSSSSASWTLRDSTKIVSPGALYTLTSHFVPFGNTLCWYKIKGVSTNGIVDSTFTKVPIQIIQLNNSNFP
jgi:Beta-1,4-xylanase